MRLMALMVAMICACAPAIASGEKSTSSSGKANVQSQKKKIARKSTRRFRTGRGAYFVPPPPPYMPSILPELHRVAEASSPGAIEGELAEVEAPPEEPYKKYFYFASGFEIKPVEHRSGVSTWRARPVSYTHSATANR
jgi:hypothetical protein